GTTEAGSTVKIYNGDEEVGDATVAPDGSWSYTASLSHGDRYQFNAKATDATGNVGVSSDFTITSDTVRPELVILGVTDEEGNNLISGASTNDTNVVLFGTSEANSWIRIYDHDSMARLSRQDVQVSEDGTWSVTVTL
ncbi:Ig-like domain-containing protein, partial [Marinomonas transparens]